MIASAIVSIFALSSSGAISHTGPGGGWTDFSAVSARNMIAHHEHALTVATAVGPVDAAARWPFRNIRPWRSEMVDGKAGRLLLTWASDHAAGSLAETRLAAEIELLVANRKSRWRRLTGSLESDGDQSKLGTVIIPSLKSELPAGAVIVLDILK